MNYGKKRNWKNYRNAKTADKTAKGILFAAKVAGMIIMKKRKKKIKRMFKRRAGHCINCGTKTSFALCLDCLLEGGQ